MFSAGRWSKILWTKSSWKVLDRCLRRYRILYCENLIDSTYGKNNNKLLSWKILCCQNLTARKICIAGFYAKTKFCLSLIFSDFVELKVKWGEQRDVNLVTIEKNNFGNNLLAIIFKKLKNILKCPVCLIFFDSFEGLYENHIVML